MKLIISKFRNEFIETANTGMYDQVFDSVHTSSLLTVDGGLGEIPVNISGISQIIIFRINYIIFGDVNETR